MPTWRLTGSAGRATKGTTSSSFWRAWPTKTSATTKRYERRRSGGQRCDGGLKHFSSAGAATPVPGRPAPFTLHSLYYSVTMVTTPFVLQCQTAWESLIALLQDRRTEDKSSGTNWGSVWTVRPPPLYPTPVSCQGRGLTGQRVRPAGVAPVSWEAWAGTSGLSRTHLTCGEGNKRCVRGQWGKERLYRFFFTFSTSCFQLMVRPDCII